MRLPSASAHHSDSSRSSHQRFWADLPASSTRTRGAAGGEIAFFTVEAGSSSIKVTTWKQPIYQVTPPVSLVESARASSLVTALPHDKCYRGGKLGKEL